MVAVSVHGYIAHGVGLGGVNHVPWRDSNGAMKVLGECGYVSPVSRFIDDCVTSLSVNVR